MDYHKLNRLADAGVVVGCISGVLCSFALLAEMGRAQASLERAQRVAESLPAPVVVAAKPSPGEDPAEEQLIEAALVEQGYYRDDVPLSYELQDALHTACQEFGVRYELALAVIERETNFTDVTGDGGESVGYFQIQPRWWGELMAEIGVDDPTGPMQNFRTGCAILAQLIERYGSEADALTAYNSGHSGESEYAGVVLEVAARLELS